MQHLMMDGSMKECCCSSVILCILSDLCQCLEV